MAVYKFKKYGTVFFQILLYFLAVFTLICGMVKYSFNDREKFYDGIIDETFDQTILNSTRYAFDTGQSIIAFPAEELYESLDKNVLLKDCHEYTRAAIDSLFTGCEMRNFESEHSELEEVVRKQFEAFTAESGSSVPEEDIIAVTELLKSNVNAQANYLPEIFNRILPKAGGYVNKYFTFLADIFFPASLLTVCAIVVVFIMNQDNFSRAAYKSVLPIWMSSVTVFIPSMIFCSYDVAASLKLKLSGMALFVQGLVNTAEREIKTWSITVFIVFTLILAACMAWYSLVQSKRHKKYI